MRERKSGSEINGEIALQITKGNESRIGDQITPTEDSGIGGNIGSAEFNEDVEEGEEVDDGSGSDEKAGPAVVHGEAIAAGHEPQQVKEEGIHEEGHQ